MKHFTIFKLLAFTAAVLPASLSAQAPESTMVIEAYSGKILVAENATLKRPIGSLAQIATAAVAVDWATASDTDIATTRITVPQTISLVGGPNPMNLQPGDQLTLRDALNSALLASDNLAALTIADHVGQQILTRRGKSGDPVVEFVGEMNQLAKALGMAQTRFANPHGMDRPGAKAYSTAADVVRLSIYAMRKNALNFIVHQKDRQVGVTGPGGQRSFRVKNTNELVGEPGILGVKTGMTLAAGPCISICMDRDPIVRQKADGTKGATPRRLVAVVLNSPNRFSRARSLINQGWSVYDPWLTSGAPVQDRERELLTVPNPQQ
jgi:D-alanyl-D-alanine carboxypeptidase (penicillin-binding protein 5/6)